MTYATVTQKMLDGTPYCGDVSYPDLGDIRWKDGCDKSDQHDLRIWDGRAWCPLREQPVYKVQK